MSIAPGRGHEALRRGRWSAPGAEYFLTICTNDRQPGLTEPSLVAAIFDAAHRLTADGMWQLRTGTLMPDHLHLLVTLGSNDDLAAAVRLFKGRLSPALRAAGLRWERGYFDHRMRANEDRLPVFLYVFLNPYRAKLLDTTERWPAYFCCPEDWSWFEPLTNSSAPFPEWLL